jgi:hypothetical protein
MGRFHQRQARIDNRHKDNAANNDTTPVTKTHRGNVNRS